MKILQCILEHAPTCYMIVDKFHEKLLYCHCFVNRYNEIFVILVSSL